MLGFGVLLVSGLLVDLLWLGNLEASPYVLTVATLIPLGISMGLINQFRPKFKKAYSWFALIGFTIHCNHQLWWNVLEKFGCTCIPWSCRLDHLWFAKSIKVSLRKNAKKSFGMVGIGGALIGIGGMALAFMNAGGNRYSDVSPRISFS